MRKFFIFISVFCCLACSVGPNYKKNEIYSDEKIAKELNIKTSSQKNISPEWFKIFNDPYLNKLIEKAIENSPNIIKAKEKLYQARYNLYITEVDLLPNFDATGEYIKSSPSQAIQPAIKQDYFQVGFDASWEIDIWGGKRRMIESQNAILKSVGADFNNVKLVLVSEIVSKYVNWRLYQKIIEETKINIDNQTNIFNTIKDKYNAGLVDNLTLNQAESLLKSTIQKLPQYIINEKKSLNALAILIGILPSEINNNNNIIMNNEFSFNIENLYNLPVQIIYERPDIFASEQKLIAQNALIGNKISKLLPSLSLKTFLGFQNTTLSPIFAKDYNMYSNTVETILPIIHWGKIVNEIKIQESATREAFENYKNTVLQGIIDVANAITTVEENIKNNKLANENYILYQDISDLSRKKYENGLISFSDYLNAEEDKISAQTKKHQSLNDMLIGITSFYKAIGGGLKTNYNEAVYQKDLIMKDDKPCKD